MGVGVRGEHVADGVGDIIEASRTAGKEINHHEKAVHLALESAMPDTHPGFSESLHVGLPFTPENVMLRRHDDGGRQPRQVCST